MDLLLDEAKSLHRKLGKNDQDKLDQYLTSVREIEQDVERSARWLDMPKPKVNAEGLTLDADNETPGKLIYAMLDLIALSFQTDSTRFVTYQLASMHGAISIANKFPSLLGSLRMLMVWLMVPGKVKERRIEGNGTSTRPNALLISSSA